MRLEAGQPPDEATEQQWQQLLREEQLALKRVISDDLENGGTLISKHTCYLAPTWLLKIVPYACHL